MTTDPMAAETLRDALLDDPSIRARFLNDVTMGAPRPGSLPWLRRRLDEMLAAARAEEAAKGPTVDALRKEFDEFYEFVNDTDPAIVDAFLFTQNNRPEAIAARRAALTPTPPPPAATVERCAAVVLDLPCRMTEDRHPEVVKNRPEYDHPFTPGPK
jgi:hypothetical protein